MIRTRAAKLSFRDADGTLRDLSGIQTEPGALAPGKFSDEEMEALGRSIHASFVGHANSDVKIMGSFRDAPADWPYKGVTAVDFKPIGGWWFMPRYKVNTVAEPCFQGGRLMYVSLKTLGPMEDLTDQGWLARVMRWLWSNSYLFPLGCSAWSWVVKQYESQTSQAAQPAGRL